MNALDLPLFMRYRPELYPSCFVGGLPRVYELSRNFRNEGLDRNHNPEFTMLEAYHAWGDVETMMELTETIVREVARAVAIERRDTPAPGHAPPDPHAAADEDSLPDELRLPFGDVTIDYGPPFRRVRYGELFESVLRFPITDHARARQEAAARRIPARNEKGVELDPGWSSTRCSRRRPSRRSIPGNPFITHCPRPSRPSR